MTPEVLFFFNRDPVALPLYESFESRVLTEVENVSIRVQKTQITYTNPRVFAAVSFLPVRRKVQRPEHYITITLGLNRRLASPRADAVTEPRPGRWTHHFLIVSPEEIDEEMMEWVRESAAFASPISKTRKSTFDARSL